VGWDGKRSRLWDSVYIYVCEVCVYIYLLGEDFVVEEINRIFEGRYVGIEGFSQIERVIVCAVCSV
jgi:hypothetical protein